MCLLPAYSLQNHRIIAKFPTIEAAAEYVNASDIRLVVVRGDDNTFLGRSPASFRRILRSRIQRSFDRSQEEQARSSQSHEPHG